MTFTLKRISYSETETAGALVVDCFPVFVTLEEAWRENRPNISCIPRGNYLCRRTVSPRFGETFEVCNVPGRSRIRFGFGNSHKDAEESILIGTYFDRIGSMNVIMESRKAFSKFLERLHGIHDFELIVTG